MLIGRCKVSHRLRTTQLSKQGFSMVELLLTICLMAILLAIAAPSVKSMIQSQEHKETARYIASMLRQARSTAIATNCPQMVIFKPNSSSYKWISYNTNNLSWNSTPVQTNTVPSLVTMRTLSTGTSTANVYVLFNSNSTVALKSQSGVASDGNVSLNNGTTQKFLVTVTNNTGRISINKMY